MLASPIVAPLTFKAEALSLAASKIRSYSISPCLNLEEQGVCLEQGPDNSQFVKIELPTSSGEELILSRDFLE